LNAIKPRNINAVLKPPTSYNTAANVYTCLLY